MEETPTWGFLDFGAGKPSETLWDGLKQDGAAIFIHVLRLDKGYVEGGSSEV